MKFKQKIRKGICATLPLITSLYFITPDHNVALAEPNQESTYHYLVGNLKRDNGEFREAFESYTKAIENDKGSAYLNNAAGEVLMQDDYLDYASTYFSRAISLDPDFLEARKNLTQLYILRGDFEEALKEVEGIIQKKPEDPLALGFAGEVMYQTEKLEEARKYFEMVTKLSSAKQEGVTAHYRLGKISLKEKKPKKAIEDFEKALSLVNKYDPTNRFIEYQSRVKIAESYSQIKEYERAKEELNKLQHELNNEEVENLVEYFLKVKEVTLEKLINQESSQKEQ